MLNPVDGGSEMYNGLTTELDRNGLEKVPVLTVETVSDPAF